MVDQIGDVRVRELLVQGEPECVSLSATFVCRPSAEIVSSTSRYTSTTARVAGSSVTPSPSSVCS